MPLEEKSTRLFSRMSLKDLNEDIYRRDYSDDRVQKTNYDPGAKGSRAGIDFADDNWGIAEHEVKKDAFSKMGEFFATKWKWIIVAMASLVFFVVIGNLAYFRGMLFDDSRITLEIVGPSEVASAETIQYTIRYENKNILSASDVELAVVFPNTFTPEKKEGQAIEGNRAIFKVENIAGQSQGEVRFSGKFYGSKGTVVGLKSTISYMPAGMSSRFEKEAKYEVTLASSPIVIEVVAPKEAASGNEVEYVISYRNESDLSFSNIRVKAEYPDGFRFNRAEPKASENDSLWRIGNLLPHASGEIRVQGLLIGSRDQAKTIRVALGVLQGDETFISYDQNERTTRIVTPPLTITQTVNGKTDVSVNPGDTLKYELKYKNEGSVGLRDVIVTLEINAALLDMTKLFLTGGHYDTAKSVITWRASDIPSLARLEPNSGGEISFSVPVRKDIAVNTEAGKHLSIRTVAKIDSLDIPFASPTNKIISSNLLDVRIGSIVDFQISGFYFDSVIGNTGPIPPKVGAETTYTLRFRVTNFLNDIAKTKVSMLIPTGVRYTGKRYPENETVSYNDRTGQLTWDIGSILGGRASVREVALQFSLNPGQNEVGKSPAIITSATLEAEDLFTRQGIRIDRGAKTTALPEDTSIPGGSYVVVP